MTKIMKKAHAGRGQATIWEIPVYLLLTALICGSGCVSTAPVLDPKEGWHLCHDQDPAQLDSAIRNDYQDYIKSLSSEERKFVGIIYLLEDGKGQHAVKIEIPLNHVWREHLLIYNAANIRIKAIRYAEGKYMS